RGIKSFHVGKRIKEELEIPFDKCNSHLAALTTTKYGVNKKELLKANFSREYLLMKRNSFIYFFKMVQIAIMATITMTVFLRTEMHKETVFDGTIYLGALFFSLTILMFNGTSEVTMTIVKLPTFFKQRDQKFYPSWAYAIPSWILKAPVTLIEVSIWVFLTYYVIGFDPNIWRFIKLYFLLMLINQAASGMFRAIAALCRNIIIANITSFYSILIFFTLGGFVLSKENSRRSNAVADSRHGKKRGMVLPFEPYSITFDEIVYSVDMPQEMKDQAVMEDRLVLLKGVSGAFRPGVLTALMGVSGAGKTTLMDVLAGRKTSGYIDGSIKISGYPKKQETFARISGYCEQNDIHSPQLTVYESLLYSAWLRLPEKVDSNTRKMFIEEVMELVELNPLRNTIVGLPGISGLSTEQRKRLTIAVELVANPSIIFMDEPTSGLDARAAAIVMRTVRNTVDTGRTVVCTIHQPSIDIFEAFDELLLMKSGGQEIYVGPLGRHSSQLINYFECIEGVSKIKDGCNPATWMLEVTSPAQELALGVDFHEIYKNSELYRRNKQLIAELGKPAPGSNDLHFPTQYSQSFLVQCMACLWKQRWSYWRNPPYTAVRFYFATFIALMFGTMFWDLGRKYSKGLDLANAMGSMYTAVFFIGVQNSASVQPVVSVERTVFYREKAAGMYSALPYALAQVVIELPYIFVQALSYGVIVYAMIGFEWTIPKFFWYIFFMYFTFCYFTFYGMMTMAAAPDHHIAAVLASAFYGLWNLFSGFLIPRTCGGGGFIGQILWLGAYMDYLHHSLEI
ncbi:pleiotropic drug resistance protein 1-like, partial [Trifolium pratense]